MTTLVGAAQQIEASNCEPQPDAETADALFTYDEDGDDVDDGNVGAAQQIEPSNCEPPPIADTADALILFEEDGDDVDDGNDL